MAHISGMVKSSDEVIGRNVKNNEDEHLGKVKEVVLDKESGRVAYVVLDSGSFLGLGGKYFALPWSSLSYDSEDSCFRVPIAVERLKNAPGFDKDNWPNMADRTWGKSVFSFYGHKAYWE